MKTLFKLIVVIFLVGFGYHFFRKHPQIGEYFKLFSSRFREMFSGEEGEEEI